LARVIVLDASVLIAFLDGDDKHHAAAEQLLTRAIDEDLAVNSLTLAEVLVVPARDGRVDRVLAALQALDVRELPFPADTVASFDERLAQTAEMRNLAVLRAS
jgi:predicted nucleic acid-binding protein